MKSYIISLLLIFLSACGAGDGEGLNAQGRPIEEIPTDPPVDPGTGISADLSSIQQHVFSPICSTCHGGANPAAGLNLSTTEQSFANLINVDSANPLFKRVLPGEPEQSYLYLKVTGNNLAGARMPLGQAALAEEEIQAIKEWIELGAKAPESLLTPTVITRVIPKTTDLPQLKSSPNSSSTAQPGRLELALWFNRAMNFSTLTTEQVAITLTTAEQQRSLNSDEFTLSQTADNILVVSINADVDVDVADAMPLALPLPTPMQQAKLQLNIEFNNNNISSIHSAHGQLLDGDYNGIDGGAFNYEHSFH